MNHKEYNGWHNYETWLVKLWIDSDRDTLYPLHFEEDRNENLTEGVIRAIGATPPAGGSSKHQ